MHSVQARVRMTTTPRVILILRQASSTPRWRKSLAQKVATTRWQEFMRKSHTVALVHLQECRKRTTLLVNPNSAVKKALRRSKQTKFRWPFSSWQTTKTLQTFVKTATEVRNYQSHSPHWCPRLTGNPRSLSCLKIFSKRASKYRVSWLKMTQSTTFILSWRGMRYKLLKKWPNRTELGRNPSSCLKETRKTPIDRDSKTQNSETCLQSSKQKVS